MSQLSTKIMTQLTMICQLVNSTIFSRHSNRTCQIQKYRAYRFSRIMDGSPSTMQTWHGYCSNITLLMKNCYSMALIPQAKKASTKPASTPDISERMDLTSGRASTLLIRQRCHTSTRNQTEMELGICSCVGSHQASKNKLM